MNASRLFRTIGLCGFALVRLSENGAAGPATAPAKMIQTVVEPIAQLAPGKAPGTMHLVYHGRAEFSMPGHCALVVTISERYHDEITAARFDDAREFTAEADLRPGSYTMEVAPAETESADYWPSEFTTIHIDKAGRLYQPRNGWTPTPGVFTLDRRMKEISPANGAIADSRRPLLKWPAVAGATHYRGDFRGSDQMKWFDVEETKYRIGAGLDAGDWCSWRVCAIDANGKMLARGEGGFFGNGTDKAIIEKLSTAAGTCGVPPQAGKPYLGIQPLPTQVPKDPKTPTERGESGSYAVQDVASGFVPGIYVAQVMPGSPAVDADLHLDDVIIAIDGQRVPSSGNEGDIRTFIQLLSEMEPGRQVTLTVRRFPRELTLHATIGQYPGGGAATQPAKKPVSVTTTPAAAPKSDTAIVAAASRVAWRDVEAGTPVTHAFHAKPGADIPLLSTNDGLAANWVNCMAELPHGGMAFGTRDGLSLWNGAEIRTYTGPSFSEQRINAIAGNSGLPANRIQDLLLDSRGRLWAATSFGVCRIDLAPNGKWRVLANPERTAFARQGVDDTLDVQRIFEASDGSIVLGGRAAGITLIDAKTDTPKLIYTDGEINHWITGIAQDSKGRIWFSVTGAGVLRYDGANVEQIRGPWNDHIDLRGLCIDGAGTVWIADGDAGLMALHADGSTEKVAQDELAGGYVERLSTDRSGRLWVTSAGGIAVLVGNDSNHKSRSWEFTGDGDSRFLWYVALNAGDGSWWISGAGVSRSQKLQLSATKPRAAAIERFKHDTERTYPNVKTDQRTAIGPGGVVVAVAGEQLMRFDGMKWEDLGELLGHPDVSRILSDIKGTVWIATRGTGLIGLDRAGGVRRYNNDAKLMKGIIHDIAAAPDGTLYAGTGDGVYRLREERWEKIQTDLPVYQVGQLVVDRRRRVWLMEDTYNNLFVYDGTRFREIKGQTDIADEELEEGSLRLDDAGNVLVNIAARPSSNLPKRTFRWDASVEGKIGEPMEVK